MLRHFRWEEMPKQDGSFLSKMRSGEPKQRWSKRSPRRNDPAFLQVSPIDLQKMNWKFQAGFHEHTGVSLQAHVPNNPRGGDTRVPQDTAQSYDCQRPSQSSPARLSAR